MTTGTEGPVCPQFTGWVTLRRVRLYGRHGVMDQERAVGAEYELTLRVGYPLDRVMETDDVADTLNYATLYALVQEEMAVPSRTLEHVGGRILRRVRDTFPLMSRATLQLVKLNPPMGADSEGAAVELCLINDKTQDE